MNRDEKLATIEEIAAQIEASEAIFAVDYRGISVPQAAELRSQLREADASFRIVKNRLTKIAAEKAGEERLAELLQGPTALAFVRGDTAQAAKAISNFNKEHDVVAFKGGFMDSLSLDEERFKAIAKLPAREVLIGQFAGVVASPLTGLVRGLGSMIQGLALQLGQIAEKGLVSGEAPAVEAAGPVEEQDSSSSQAAGEEPSSAPPADEAEEPKDEAEAEEPDAAPDKADDEDAPSAGGAVGGTAAEDASATAGGGGSPAATGPVGRPDLDEITRMWPAVIHKLGETSPALAATFDGARPVSMDDEGLKVGFPAEFTFNKRKAEAPEKRELMADAIESVLGERIKPAYVLLDGDVVPNGDDEEAPDGEIDHDALVEKLKSEFDAKEVG
jgi:large subunit ribosomal protein L10